jgi:hypothetical protein
LPPPLQFPFLHASPAQHRCPLPPHATHVVLAWSHTSPVLHQKPPALLPGQHGSPGPPHPVHALPAHAVNGAVHPTPPPQHASLGPPHAPPPHAPCLHVPWPPPQAPPPATHVFMV